MNKLSPESAAKAAENYIFALDIGTRSVIGVVGSMAGDRFKIAAVESMEHSKRAMIDGQIEDIAEVASVAQKVKRALEDRLGVTLKRVCVAAAGRALKTAAAEWSMKLSKNEPISRETLYELEMGAVSLASEEIAKTADSAFDFYCVGYSVKRFYLDDYAYSTLLGHKGKKARAQVIATFLPREVVESLSAAMARIGLEIAFLTLEPIAAMNAVIPPELRLLNLALVDIGAGTSDIALCEENTVTAYTMATVAGDEITEELIRRYLVDFSTAEAIKHSLGQEGQTVSFTDIMGFDYTVDKAEVAEAAAGPIENLANVICDKVVECNGHSPSAVFLVGGGSKVPTLCELVADRLGIDRRKVAVGGNNFMKRVVVADSDLCGPEYATPLGIALTAAAAGENHGFSITLNGQRRQLFKNSALTLMDVLLLCGYKYSDILGKNGRSLEYELGGRRRVIRGSHLKPAVLRINGEDVGITSPVRSGDAVDVVPAENGVDAALTAAQLTDGSKPVTLNYEGAELKVGNVVFANGRRVPHDYRIQNKDQMSVERVVTLDHLYAHLNVSREHDSLLVNGVVQPGDYLLREGDSVSRLTALAALPSPEEQSGPGSRQDAPLAGAARAVTVTLNGQRRTVSPKADNASLVFLDLLNLVDIDPSKPKGDIVLTHNGQIASFLQPIAEGDVIEIRWA